MNGKTARFLRRAAAVLRRPYADVKADWIDSNHMVRGAFKKMVRAELLSIAKTR